MKEDGSRCGAPHAFVDPETGLCWTHSDEGREKVREAARKGGQTTAKRLKGRSLDPDDLPPLTTAQAAEAWCDVIGRAVVSGALSHNQAQAALRAVREWRESHEAGEVSDRLDALMDALQAWRETGDPQPVLQLVDGGER